MDFFPVLPETRVMKWVKLSRERLSAVRGEVSASVGLKVNPLDVLVRATPPKEIRPVQLTRVMGLREKDIPKNLHKHAGDYVESREVIISKRLNVFNERLIYPAPGSGRILALQGSWMMLELDGLPTEMRSLYRGVVTHVHPQVGVTIEAEGAWAQGIWGAGTEAYGLLKVVTPPDEVLTEEKVDVSVRGMIVLAGIVESISGLTSVARGRAAGLIIGSLPANLKAVAENLGIPVIVTEGFGRIPMAQPIFDLLKNFSGGELCVNSGIPTHLGARRIRPEVFVPVARADKQPPAQYPTPLVNQLGATVRVVREPYLGQVGKIAQVSPHAQVLESGARTFGAEIELTRGRVFVPWANLELIG